MKIKDGLGWEKESDKSWRNIFGSIAHNSCGIPIGERSFKLEEILSWHDSAISAERERVKAEAVGIVGDDKNAMTYQSMAQYRSAVIKAIKAIKGEGDERT